MPNKKPSTNMEEGLVLQIIKTIRARNPNAVYTCPHRRMVPAFQEEKEKIIEERKLWTNFTEKINIDPDFCTAVDYTTYNQYAGKRFFCNDGFDSETGRKRSELYPCKHLASSGLDDLINSPINSPQYCPSRYKSLTPSQTWSTNPSQVKISWQ